MSTPCDVAWADRPSEQEATAAQQLVRVNGTTPFVGIILSRRLIGVKVHFWRGRTTPHLTGPCPACDDRSPWRWRGYLCVTNERATTRAALELTAPCVDALDIYNRQWGTIRGGRIKLWRPTQKPNGRIACEMTPGKIPTTELPEEFDLEKLLFKLWEVQRHTSQPTTRTVALLQPEDGAA